MTRKIAFAIVCLMMAAAPALAQAPPNVPASPAPAQADCAPGSRVNPPGTPGATTGQTQEPLGEKLARTDGVLCPPEGVDPEIRVPAPSTGTMRVIPPPGSPGGDQNVQPK